MRRGLLVSLLLVLAACGGGDGGDPEARDTPEPAQGGGGPTREYAVEIEELGGSGVSGRADMRSIGSEQSEVAIELEDAPDGPLAVHMHEGPCRRDAAPPTHELEPVEDGRSESVIGASVQGLTHGHFHLAIHESDDEDSEHIACGQISGPPIDE